MKNWNGLEERVVSTKPRRDGVRGRALLATFVTLVVMAGLEGVFPGVRYWSLGDSQGRVREKPFRWSQIEPKPHLEFHKCFNNFECAKLSLPLDYFNGTYSNDTVSIAIAKLPSKFPVDHPRYGGPVLINPGGPGGEGTYFAIGAAQSLQTVVDSEKSFDIIGFDPRGLGESEPLAECLPDDPSAWSWALRENNEGILGSSDAALGRLWSMTHAYGSACKQVMDYEEGPNVKEYMSTASVARDMLEIVEKHAEYVAKEVARLSTQATTSTRPTTPVAYKPGTAKLQYWGFSYGTYLGATFSSMFPDRVGRLVLDGVVTSHDYNHALGNGSLIDTEKTMKSFYTFCNFLGPEQCPLATANGSITDIETRFQGIVKSLYHKPLIINAPDGVPEIFTFSDLKLFVLLANYVPQLAFPFLALLMAAVEAGGGVLLENLSFAYRSNHVYQCPIEGYAPRRLAAAGVAQISILCGDGIDQSHLSIDDFTEFWHLLESRSPTAGSVWASIGIHCAGWKIRPKYTFQGPFGGQTSHPILFVSNTADPVTPLRSARIMHNKFPGSALLIGDIPGHCSLALPNPCTLAHIRTYFQTGTLPPPHALCIPPPSPFSLNSTDPTSPFYDPSLDHANIVPYNQDDEIHNDQDTFDEPTHKQSTCSPPRRNLLRTASDLQEWLVDYDAFGFQKLFVKDKSRAFMSLVSEWNTYMRRVHRTEGEEEVYW